LQMIRFHFSSWLSKIPLCTVTTFSSLFCEHFSENNFNWFSIQLDSLFFLGRDSLIYDFLKLLIVSYI
jgi:hypothetical protein